MSGRLQGKTALVTGAAQGIGAAVVRAMRREGAIVYAADINEPGVSALAADCGATAACARARERLPSGCNRM